MGVNTLLLRFEGPLQAWGNQESKFAIRRTADAPTKSGVMGILLAAMGIPRADARRELKELNHMLLGVRIDRPGIRWWDYHTVGAGTRMPVARGEGENKPGAMLTRREYLCDASFLVALQGDGELIMRLRGALLNPRWPLHLGRKCCPLSLPLIGRRDQPDTGEFSGLIAALRSVPWHPRTKADAKPETVECLLEWRAQPPEDTAPVDAEIWYDVARSFDVPGHEARFVLRQWLKIEAAGQLQTRVPPPPRPRADYGNSEYKKRRQQRLDSDHGLCVFCKSPATTVQHVTYRRAGGNEDQEDLRSLCRLCHDAVTMIEYGLGMGLDRINPEDPRFRAKIIQKRGEIIAFRSLETRRRRLDPEDSE